MSPADVKLTKFEGRKVDAVGIEIRNAAGGLQDAMKVDPEEWHLEDEITVVIRCRVTKIRHDPLKDTDGLRRVHILTAEEATVIEDDLVADALDEQKRRIEEVLGVQRLPIELIAAHEEGGHAEESVDGCPLCDEERGKK